MKKIKILIVILIMSVFSAYAQNAKNFIEEGKKYAKEGDSDKAEASYSKAIKMEPNNAEAYYLRGKLRVDFCYDCYDQVEVGYVGFFESIKDLTKAIEINPNYKEAYQLLGTIYHRQDKNSEANAKKYMARAIELNPKFAETYIFYYVEPPVKHGLQAGMTKEELIREFGEPLKIDSTVEKLDNKNVTAKRYTYKISPSMGYSDSTGLSIVYVFLLEDKVFSYGPQP